MNCIIICKLTSNERCLQFRGGKTRENWIDIIKGFAIIAVVMFHTTYKLPELLIGNNGNLLPLSSILGPLWHVPVFLCIGGFFLKEDELIHPAQFIKKKWNTLYIKLLCFYGIFILLHNLFFKIGFYSKDVLYVGKHIYPLESIGDWIKQIGWAFVAAREPFLAAMWFINLMFISMCLISFIAWFSNKINKEKLLWIIGLIILGISTLASLSTHILNIHITRLMPSIVGTSIIFMGFILNKKIKLQFDNIFIFIASLIIIYEIACIYGGVSLSEGLYPDIVVLLVSTIACLYVLAFIAKKIKTNVLGKLFAYCGKESYYIMALHFLGFKVATIIINFFEGNKELPQLSSQANTCLEWLFYTICGVIFSLAISKLVDGIKQLSFNILGHK